MKTLRIAAHVLVIFCGMFRVAPGLDSIEVDSNRRSPILFNRDIRPILTENCIACHGPDAHQRQANLRLDMREGALRSSDTGHAAIVPGEPKQSQLVARIRSLSDEDRMPPPSTHKQLTSEQIDKLVQWVASGAEYDSHWAFSPLTRPPLPSVRDAGWPRNAIDIFVLARLEAQNLGPAAQAPQETLSRRLSLDLLGLPLSSTDVHLESTIATQTSLDDFVEKLLSSPHFGERMAVDWLDAARFADTNGYQVDRDREMYAWRDWVIRAFNNNMPFDQFTIEQVAGDLLPAPTIEQRIATGFHRNHMMNEEGGIIPEEFLAEYTAERVETTAAVWLGQTLNCARCHDHKFDPFSQRDFYSLKAFFHNVTEKGVGNYGAPIRVNNPPYLRLATDQQTTELTNLQSELSRFKQQLNEIPRESAEQTAEKERQIAAAKQIWEPTRVTLVESGNKDLAAEASDGWSVRIAAADQPSANIQFRLVGLPRKCTAIRIQCLDAGKEGSLRWHDLRRVEANRVLENQDTSTTATEKLRSAFKLRAIESDAALVLAEANKLVDEVRQTNIVVNLKKDSATQAVFELDPPVGDSTGEPVELVLELALSRLTADSLWRVEATNQDTLVLAPSDIRTIAAKEDGTRSVSERQRLTEFLDSRHPAIRVLKERQNDLNKKIEELEKTVHTALVMEEMSTPRPTFVLLRGVYDKLGDRVEPGTPAALPPMRFDAPRNRLGLAQWLVSADNPLTARVITNRIWQSIFGAGLVRTTEDFGVQGEPPSHPELLDWLATELVESGWNVKHVMRLIVSSATYRQSSVVAPWLGEIDPENRLLARGPRFRLQAEFVRDQALSLSGVLSSSIGGPSVKPYHPPGLYEQVVAGSSANTYVQGEGDELRRRSLYTYWKRSVPNPAMLIFDAPFREVCALRRTRTNTPLQALNLMNEPTYVEAARFLAERMMREGGSEPLARLTFGFQVALGRTPNERELAILNSGWQRAFGEFQGDSVAAIDFLGVGDLDIKVDFDVAEWAAYSSVANTLLCLDELVTKN